MHLCKPCEESRDWATDPVVKTKIEVNAQRDERLKARCGTCREYVRNPMFGNCDRCARRERLCQHCGKTTLTLEEQAIAQAAAAVDEGFERLVDDFTQVVKRCGIRSDAAKAFIEGCDAPMAEKLSLLTLGDLDKRVDGRPVLHVLFGSRKMWDRTRVHCDRCVDEHRAPAFAKGQNCGHFTFAEHQAWCLHCALEEGRCSSCGAKFEHEQQETHLTPTN